MKKVREYKKGEKHHWWPEVVSKHWTNESGLISAMNHHGETHRARPNRLAKISDGHNTQFGVSTPWESTFEDEFDNADANFPKIIEWLVTLTKKHEDENLKSDRIHNYQTCSDSEYMLATECISSLVVRSPKFRSYAVSLAEHVRGPLDKRERNHLISANLRHKHPELSKALSNRGKMVVIFSPSKEFIFGDGFYQNIPPSNLHALSNPKILVPITPNISILYTRPMQYGTQPRLMTRCADDALVEFLNNTVQTYSKDWIFFRNEKPEIKEYFSQNKHLIYDYPEPVDRLIFQIPGVDRPKYFPF